MTRGERITLRNQIPLAQRCVVFLFIAFLLTEAGDWTSSSAHFEITAIFPTVDPAKNGYCGFISDNKCELTSADPNVAKLVLEVKNIADETISTDHLWDLTVYANDVPLPKDRVVGGIPQYDDVAGWSISSGYDTEWAPGSTKDIALSIICGDLAEEGSNGVSMIGGTLNLTIRPPFGTPATTSITCEQCCQMQPSRQSECSALCSEAFPAIPGSTSSAPSPTLPTPDSSSHLEITAIYPTEDPAKNGYCGPISDNKCELTPDDPNLAKLIIEVKNAGTPTIEAYQLWDLKLYANDVQLSNSSEWSIFQGYNQDWPCGFTKDIALNIDCGDIVTMPGGVLKIEVLPLSGSGTANEITCLQCCARQMNLQQECAAECGYQAPTPTPEPTPIPTPIPTPRPPSPPLPTYQGWPMFGYNEAHTGRAEEDVPPPLEVRWQFDANEHIYKPPSVMDGAVYTGSRDENVYSINVSTGEEIWRFKTSGAIYSSPAVSGGVVYCGSNDNTFYAIEAVSGDLKWNYTTGGVVQTAPVVSDGTVFFSSNDLHFYALDAETGALRWKVERPGMTSASPAIAYGISFWGDSTSDKGILALNVSTGEEVWSYATGSGITNAPVVYDGLVFAGMYPWLYAIDAFSGELAWKYQGTSDFGSPAVSDGVVYAGAGVKLYALNVTTGDLKWTYETDMGRPYPAIGNGIVYIGATNYLFAIDPEDGEKLWDLDTTSYGSSGSIPVISNGMVFIKVDRSIIALQPYTPGNATPTPVSTPPPSTPPSVPPSTSTSTPTSGPTSAPPTRPGSTSTPAPSSTASSTPTSVPTYQPTPPPTSTPGPTSDVPDQSPTPLPTPTPSSSGNFTGTPTPRPSPVSNATPSDPATPTVEPPVNATPYPPVNATPDPSVNATQVPSQLPIPTSPPTPITQKRKPIGSICYSNDECAGNNCQNMRCCSNGKTCCGFDHHCGLNDTCNRALAHCVPKPPPPSREVLTQNLTALTRDVKDLVGRKGDAERALQKVLDRHEIEHHLGKLDTLVEELEALSGEFNITTDEVVNERKMAAEKALRKVKDIIVTNITEQRTFEEVEVRMDEKVIDSVIDKLTQLTSERALQVKNETMRIAKNITRKQKVEVVEAEYASGRKGKKTLVTQTVVNTDPEPIENATVVVQIPKNVAISALLLRYKCVRSSGRPCPRPRILRDDPIVGWDLSVLEPGETVTMTYTVEGEITPEETGQDAVLVTTSLDLEPYRTVEDTRESLTTEVIEQNLTSLSAEILTIEDSEVRERIENLTGATQESLAEADLITAYAAVAQIRQEIEAAKVAVATPEPTSTPIPEPVPSETPVSTETPVTTPINETGKPFSLRDSLGTFVENWEIFIGLCGALSIIGYYLQILKRKTLGEEKVKVKRGVTREGNIIKIGVKVVNDSTFALVDVSVQLDVPKAFRIEGGSKFIDLGILKQGEYQSAIFKLVPTRCVSGNITGTVTYHDVKNNRKVLEVQEVTVGSVCPFLEKVPVTYEAFEEKVKPLPSHDKRLKYSEDPGAIYQKLQGKCSSMHVVHEGYSDDGTKYIGLYSARGAYSKNFIGMRLGLDMSSNELVVKVYGEQEEMVTGLLGEIVELLEAGDE